jgi:hypothetical protein
MAPALVRYSCMIFGLANVTGSVAYGGPRDMFMLVVGVMVGGAWFAFGKYGGLPLVDTVVDWCPPRAPSAIEPMHLQGLLVMRRRRWILWASIPGAIGVAALLIPLLMKTGRPERIVIVLGVLVAYVNLRYYLSRCPRCGLGFFTRSASRGWGNTCGHCGLSLYAYKNP